MNWIAKKLECPCTNLSLPRKRKMSDGRYSYHIQCLDCGSPVGSMMGKVIAYQGNQGKIPEDFNEELLLEKKQTIQNLYETEKKEMKEREEAEKQNYYKYLATEKWYAKRQKVLSRANGICEGCAEKKATIVHHLTYEHIFHELLFELVALCRECHKQAHEKKRINEK